MTADEKAKELYDKFYDKVEDVESRDGGGWSSNSYLIEGTVKTAARQCALIAVDEILNNIEQIWLSDDEQTYWQQVKLHLQNL